MFESKPSHWPQQKYVIETRLNEKVFNRTHKVETESCNRFWTDFRTATGLFYNLSLLCSQCKSLGGKKKSTSRVFFHSMIIAFCLKILLSRLFEQNIRCVKAFKKEKLTLFHESARLCKNETLNQSRYESRVLRSS